MGTISVRRENSVPLTANFQGKLLMKRATPVVRAVFGNYDLKELRSGEWTFGLPQSAAEPTWQEILGSLLFVVAQQVIVPPGGKVPVREKISAFAKGLHPEASIEAFVDWLMGCVASCKPPTVPDLYCLVRGLNDGHGLEGCVYVSSEGNHALGRVETLWWFDECGEGRLELRRKALPWDACATKN